MTKTTVDIVSETILDFIKEQSFLAKLTEAQGLQVIASVTSEIMFRFTEVNSDINKTLFIREFLQMIEEAVYLYQRIKR